MRKIGICDDNCQVVDRIKDICNNFYGNENVRINCFYSGESLLVSQQHFDVLFLDIELDNINGIETALKIRKTDMDVLIIIVSAYEDYKKEAYPIHAFDFIDKPIEEDRFHYVLNEIEVYHKKKNAVEYGAFKVKDGYVKLDLAEILYFAYEGRKIKIVTIDNEYDYCDSISELAKRMEMYDFFMVHRAYLINLRHIKAIRRKEVVICTGEVFPLSRYKSKEFKDVYTKYISDFFK